jgi:hypothetical protein
MSSGWKASSGWSKAGIKVIVGTGAQHRERAWRCRPCAKGRRHGLMVIPRVLSRGSVVGGPARAFQGHPRSRAEGLPAVIYNSPYYGFETKADLFFALRAEHPNLIGFKEFGGEADLTYAAEHITSGDRCADADGRRRYRVFHGFVNCGARRRDHRHRQRACRSEVLHLVALCEKAASQGDATARRKALELEEALTWCFRTCHRLRARARGDQPFLTSIATPRGVALARVAVAAAVAGDDADDVIGLGGQARDEGEALRRCRPWRNSTRLGEPSCPPSMRPGGKLRPGVAHAVRKPLSARVR